MKFGVIGCGAIAVHHVLAGKSQPGCDVIACADVNLDSAQRFADRFQVPRVFSDGQSLLQLDELDLVVVCTPPKWHADLVLSALRQGKHVLVEKPLFNDARRSRRHRRGRRTDRSNRRYGAGPPLSPGLPRGPQIHRSRRTRRLRHVRLSLGRSMLSDSRFAAPDNDSRSWLVDCDIAGGGVLMSSSIHFFSVVSYLLGDHAARSVEGHVRQLHPAGFRRIEDDVDIVVRWDNGVEFNHRESWVTDLPYQAEIVGEAGRLTISGADFKSLAMRAECRGPLPPPYDTLDQNGPATNEKLESVERQPTLFSGLWADLVYSIRLGLPVARLPDVLHARNMQAIVAAGYQAASTGQLATVRWLPREFAITA